MHVTSQFVVSDTRNSDDVEISKIQEVKPSQEQAVNREVEASQDITCDIEMDGNCSKNIGQKNDTNLDTPTECSMQPASPYVMPLSESSMNQAHNSSCVESSPCDAPRVENLSPTISVLPRRRAASSGTYHVPINKENFTITNATSNQKARDSVWTLCGASSPCITPTVENATSTIPIPLSGASVSTNHPPSVPISKQNITVSKNTSNLKTGKISSTQDWSYSNPYSSPSSNMSGSSTDGRNWSELEDHNYGLDYTQKLLERAIAMREIELKNQQAKIDRTKALFKEARCKAHMMVTENILTVPEVAYLQEEVDRIFNAKEAAWNGRFRGKLWFSRDDESLTGTSSTSCNIMPDAIQNGPLQKRSLTQSMSIHMQVNIPTETNKDIMPAIEKPNAICTDLQSNVEVINLVDLTETRMDVPVIEKLDQSLKVNVPEIPSTAVMMDGIPWHTNDQFLNVGGVSTRPDNRAATEVRCKLPSSVELIRRKSTDTCDPVNQGYQDTCLESPGQSSHSSSERFHNLPQLIYHGLCNLFFYKEYYIYYKSLFSSKDAARSIVAKNKLKSLQQKADSQLLEARHLIPSDGFTQEFLDETVRETLCLKSDKHERVPLAREHILRTIRLFQEKPQTHRLRCDEVFSKPGKNPKKILITLKPNSNSELRSEPERNPSVCPVANIEEDPRLKICNKEVVEGSDVSTGTDPLQDNLLAVVPHRLNKLHNTPIEVNQLKQNKDVRGIMEIGRVPKNQCTQAEPLNVRQIAPVASRPIQRESRNLGDNVQPQNRPDTRNQPNQWKPLNVGHHVQPELNQTTTINQPNQRKRQSTADMSLFPRWQSVTEQTVPVGVQQRNSSGSDNVAKINYSKHRKVVEKNTTLNCQKQMETTNGRQISSAVRKGHLLDINKSRCRSISQNNSRIKAQSVPDISNSGKPIVEEPAAQLPAADAHNKGFNIKHVENASVKTTLQVDPQEVIDLTEDTDLDYTPPASGPGSVPVCENSTKQVQQTSASKLHEGPLKSLSSLERIKNIDEEIDILRIKKMQAMEASPLELPATLTCQPCVPETVPMQLSKQKNKVETALVNNNGQMHLMY